MITINDLAFSYKKKKPLFNNLNLKLSEGRIHGLLGKNGAGKTTLLKLISGLLFPDDGIINTMGYVPSRRKPEMLQDIYFLFEEYTLPDFSIKKFLKVYSGFYPKFNENRFSHYLKEFEINANEKLNHLSYGQKKKVLIAFGLATNTKLLIMDEPTNGLDIPSKSQFRKIIAGEIDERKCVIISTHQVRDLDSLIDSITIIDQQNIIISEPIENITKKLCFKAISSIENEEKVLFSESGLKGNWAVIENYNNEDSKLDIEMLFNATFANKKRMQSIFNNLNNTL
ncbi:MAG: ABC transporter ATP-binding protein [Bacteroidota bacterium]